MNTKFSKGKQVLGITIDNKLKFDIDDGSIYQKVNRKVKALVITAHYAELP